MNKTEVSAESFDINLSWQLLRKLEKEYGDSFYILNIRKFESNYHEFLSAFRSIYPNTKIAYSYKTNYTPWLCEYLNSMGGYAEVVSRMEYDLAVRIGVSPERIIYNGPLKLDQDIENAILAGSIVNLDALYEVKIVQALAQRLTNSDITVGVRCNFDVGTGFVSRFGFDVEGGELDYVFDVIGRFKNCSISGLHCHFSTPQRSIESYALRTKKMLEISTRYFKKHYPRFINVGGGFFGKMSLDLKKQFDCSIPNYKEYAEVIASQFLDAFSGESGPELIIEPGISIVGDVMKFVGKIVGLKTIRSRKLALVTGSINNIKPTLNDKKLPMQVYHNDKKNNNEEIKGTVDVCGYTCMEHDCLYEGYEGIIAVGDYVVFDHVGAYTTVLTPPFISPSPPIISYDPVIAKYELIKRKGAFEEVFSSYIM